MELERLIPYIKELKQSCDNGSDRAATIRVVDTLGQLIESATPQNPEGETSESWARLMCVRAFLLDKISQSGRALLSLESHVQPGGLLYDNPVAQVTYANALIHYRHNGSNRGHAAVAAKHLAKILGEEKFRQNPVIHNTYVSALTHSQQWVRAKRHLVRHMAPGQCLEHYEPAQKALALTERKITESRNTGVDLLSAGFHIIQSERPEPSGQGRATEEINRSPTAYQQPQSDHLRPAP